MDLRLDIERRKKYSTHESDPKQDQGRDSPNSSRERSMEKFSKCHKRSEKSNKKRSRSSSSSSSSSRTSQHVEDMPTNKSDAKDEGFNKTRLGQGGSQAPERGQTLGGFQVRIRGRGWNRGNCRGNSSHINPLKMAEHQKNSEGWEPEYTPKSKQYYLHDNREGEADHNRGRGRGSVSHGRARFIIRKAIAGSATNGPRWAHDKFQANGEQGGSQEAERGQDHNEGKPDGDAH